MIQVLMVDDAKSVHAFTKNCLLGTKVELFPAYDGQQALDELAKGTRSFQLILLDWEMPVLDGPKTFAELKKQNINIPVIMMTSRNSIEDISNMLAAGVSEYIMKPFTKDILISKIESILGTEVSA
ncbi:MAG: response regulator [Bdellovibrionia bacterium]